MKKFVHLLSFMVQLLYWGVHIYFAYVAFTQFSLWFALVVTFLPVGGDMLLLGACIYEGNWMPMIIFAMVGIIHWLAPMLVSRIED